MTAPCAPGALPLALACAGLLLAAGGPISASPPQRDALVVEVSSWVFPSRPVEVTLEQRGVLAGRRLAVELFIDQNQLKRVKTQSDRTRTRLETPDLPPGTHVLMAKSGTEEARAEFRVIPWSWLAAAVVCGIGAAVSGFVWLQRRRQPRAA